MERSPMEITQPMDKQELTTVIVVCTIMVRYMNVTGGLSASDLCHYRPWRRRVYPCRKNLSRFWKRVWLGKKFNGLLQVCGFGGPNIFLPEHNFFPSTRMILRNREGYCYCIFCLIILQDHIGLTYLIKSNTSCHLIFNKSAGWGVQLLILWTFRRIKYNCLSLVASLQT